MEDSIKLFKALADASRLKILSSLMGSPMYVELLAERLELSPSTVSFHLKKLEEAGLVKKHKDQYYIVYEICPERLNLTLASLIHPQTAATDEESLREQAYRQKIIDTFFKFGKLTSIPVQRKKRLVVLEHLVQAFEYGKTFSEREVNIIIADYHDDFATLRREMIIEKLMSRENGVYKRL